MPGVDGKIALVTGAGRGIGRHTAEILMARGAEVIGVSRSEDELSRLGCPYIAKDLGSADGCSEVIKEAEKRFGRIDILVCNHGIGSAHESVVWEQDPEDWRQTMRVNLDGPFYLSRMVLPGMKERGFGRLVYTSSTSGLIPEYAGSAYNSSKHGLIGLMRSVSVDAGEYGVTANAVLPGWVKTEMAELSAATEAKEQGVTTDQVWEERAALYPAGRVLAPEEVAEVIAFLSSEEASGVSGEAIRVALGGVL